MCWVGAASQQVIKLPVVHHPRLNTLSKDLLSISHGIKLLIITCNTGGRYFTEWRILGEVGFGGVVFDQINQSSSVISRSWTRLY